MTSFDHGLRIEIWFSAEMCSCMVFYHHQLSCTSSKHLTLTHISVRCLFSDWALFDSNTETNCWFLISNHCCWGHSIVKNAALTGSYIFQGRMFQHLWSWQWWSGRVKFSQKCHSLKKWCSRKKNKVGCRFRADSCVLLTLCCSSSVERFS